MRKLSAVGAIAIGMLGLSIQVGAQPVLVINDITGAASKIEQTCTQIVWSFSAADCTMGRNRPNPDAPTAWVGHARNGGYYAIGGVGDSLTYDGNTLNDPNLIQPAITGTMTIDDNGTAIGTDDKISAAFSLGPTARNVSTGQFTRAITRWNSMDHVMAPYTVNGATANAEGGFDYTLGDRGIPWLLQKTPGPDFVIKLTSKTDVTDLWPSDKGPSGGTITRYWAPIPAMGSIGVERSGELGGPGWDATTNPILGNVGPTTTATFEQTGLTPCVTNNAASNDCRNSVIVWGAIESPGFDNLTGVIRTNGSGKIIQAKLFWTQEYFIGAFGGIAGFDNSYQTGTLTFTGQVQGVGATDDDFNVLEGSSNNQFDVLANDRGYTPPITLTIVTPPGNGTATVSAGKIVYTPNAGLTPDSLVYNADDGTLSSNGTVTITVVADTSPVAPDGPITISTAGVAPASAPGSLDVSTLGGYSAGNGPVVLTLTAPNPATGTVSKVGTTVTYTPNATFFTGGDTFGYTLTDSDGDTESGVITVTIADVSPTLANGSITTDQDKASSALALAFTAGNGSVAQHTLAVTGAAQHGTCAITGTSLTYTPAAAYFGPDACTVTITDGDGDTNTAGTGTITITVNEVANQLILPGGGGALDLWSLSLLAGLPLLRRRRGA